ncbi:MAG: hypothetical protein ACRD3V_07550, partial [Vicinamibacteria bacterium]
VQGSERFGASDTGHPDGSLKMRLFPPRGGEPAGGATKSRSGRAPRGWEVVRQRSLALPKLVEPLESRTIKSFSVLDLGAASPANIEFFGGRGARLTVADFAASSIDALGALVRSDPGVHFDLVLAWDLLNYLQREKLGVLLTSLEPYFRPGTTIHAFIATARDMPASPRRYRIEDKNTLLCEQRQERVIPSPRYVEQDLLRCMPGLIVEHRFQLRNGMLEYLFSYRTRLRVAYSAISDAPRSRSGSGIGWSQSPSR